MRRRRLVYLARAIGRSRGLLALALRVIAERLEHREAPAELLNVAQAWWSRGAKRKAMLAAERPFEGLRDRPVSDLCAHDSSQSLSLLRKY
jgi:hypothetical protein